MLLIKDIMSKDVFTVESDASAEEAAWGLTRRHLTGAPVVDRAGNVLGMLSTADLTDPEPHQWIKGEATVGDLMTPEVVSLYGDDPALAAANEMIKRDVHRVVVLGSDSKMVGIVTPMDVVRAVASGRRFDLKD